MPEEVIYSGCWRCERLGGQGRSGPVAKVEIVDATPEKNGLHMI